MKERPILFSGQMVRAVLDGRKTQTRRVVKCKRGETLHVTDGREVTFTRCPYGKPGDRLWVRETWATCQDSGSGLIYRADTEFDLYVDEDCTIPVRFRPSIHMPRWASRITLEITGVRVERVRDITEDDAKVEGVDEKTVTLAGGVSTTPHRFAFEVLWDSINAKRGFGWDLNPWVWVVSFKRV